MESELQKGATVAPANASLCARHLVDGSDFVEKGNMLLCKRVTFECRKEKVMYPRMRRRLYREGPTE
jgi:hypothetical protein